MKEPQELTLRDYFAAQAIPRLLATIDHTVFQLEESGTNYFPYVSRVAYKLADEMLKAREAKK